MFLGAGTPVNQAPTAAFTANCTSLKCHFDASGSSDSDGTVASYSWDFGDNTTGTGVTPPDHVYSGNGDYSVTLVVKDNQNKSSAPLTKTVSVTNAPPTADFNSVCSAQDCNFTSTSTDSDGTIASYAWTFGDSGTATTAQPAHHYGSPGTYDVTLTVTDNYGATSQPVTKQVTVTSTPTGAQFVAAANAGGGNVKTKQVTIPTQAHAGDTAVLFFSASSTGGWGNPTGVTGWTQVDTFTTGSLLTTAWQKTLTAGDVGATVRFDTSGFTHASANVIVYSGVNTSNPIAAVAHSGDNGTSHVTPTATAGAGDWVLSLWADRSSATRTWTGPSGATRRDVTTDSGGLTIQSLVADSDGPSTGGTVGGVTATTDAAASVAKWTIVLNSA
jgi:PKD repeat protein